MAAFGRIALAIIAGGCGRVGFDAVVDGDIRVDGAVLPPGRVLVIPMDDDPPAAGGGIESSDAMLEIRCDGTFCPTPTVGQRNGAYHFTGAQRFEIPRPTLFNASGFTVSVWLRPDATGVMQAAVAKPAVLETGTDVTSLLVDDSGFVSFEWTADGENPRYTIGQFDVTDGAWHQVTLTWDGATRRIYVDGLQKTLETGGMPLVDSSFMLTVGSDLDGTGPVHWFHGELDELSFWDRALTRDEVATLQAL